MTTPERWLFLSHVDWRWIKQRPHWLAEAASEDARVLFLYRLHPRRLRLPKNTSCLRRMCLLPLPLGSAHSSNRFFNTAFLIVQRCWVAIIALLYRPTHIYVAHPKLWSIIPAFLPGRVHVTYDCMDDAVAMAPPEQRERLCKAETQLCTHAHTIAVSSRTLGDRLRNQLEATVSQRIRLVQNGISSGGVAIPDAGGSHRREMAVKLGYAGTVARWFDFESLIFALDSNPTTSIDIVGPRTGQEPTHGQITFLPPVEHSMLPGILGRCDALIMPFDVDDIVTAVNPVKLYEYLRFHVPVIARKYPEIEHDFAQFVYFYSSPGELAGLIQCLVHGELPPLGTRQQRDNFLKTSTWSARWAHMRDQTEGAQGR